MRKMLCTLSISIDRDWINPDGSDAATPYEVELDPANMDEAGCIFFTKPDSPEQVIEAFYFNELLVVHCYSIYLNSTTVYRFSVLLRTR